MCATDEELLCPGYAPTRALLRRRDSFARGFVRTSKVAIPIVIRGGMA